MDAGDDGSDGTYYDVLGVAPTASDEAIRDQYLAVAKVVHPDVGGDPAMFMVLQEAYDTVGDRVRRAEYDRLLVTEGLRRVARAAEQQPAVAAPAQGWGLLRPSTPEQRARGRGSPRGGSSTSTRTASNAGGHGGSASAGRLR